MESCHAVATTYGKYPCSIWCAHDIPTHRQHNSMEPRVATALSSIRPRCLKTVVKLTEEWGCGSKKKHALQALPEHTAWQRDTLSSIDNAPPRHDYWKKSMHQYTLFDIDRLVKAKARWGHKVLSTTRIVSLKSTCTQLNKNRNWRFTSLMRATRMGQAQLAFPPHLHGPTRCSCAALCNAAFEWTRPPLSSHSHIWWSGTACPSHPDKATVAFVSSYFEPFILLLHDMGQGIEPYIGYS